jgi:GH43 family beta-xylosidase
MRRARPFAAALLLAAALGSPGGAAQERAPSCPGAPGEGVAASRLGRDHTHLILDLNFPDPFVARFAGLWHAYATGNQVGGGQMNVQYVRSRGLAGWSVPTEALPAANLPAWVDRAHPQVWAPEVMAVGGRYVLYFNARHASLTRTERPPQGPVVRKRHCLGAAVADRPEGPFRGVDAPLVCSEFEEGTIDASPFRDGDSLYVYYKHDANCCGGGSALYVQGLSPDGLAALGAPAKLLASNDSPEAHDDWEWRVVEAPTMVKRAGTYYLFYSGNFYGNRNYAVGYLSCASPRGPCTDLGDNPILWAHKKTALLGPGHQSVLDHKGRSYIFFHGWNEDPDARERPGFHKRCLYVSRLRWDRWSRARHPVPTVVGGSPTPRP